MLKPRIGMRKMKSTRQLTFAKMLYLATQARIAIPSQVLSSRGCSRVRAICVAWALTMQRSASVENVGQALKRGLRVAQQPLLHFG